MGLLDGKFYYPTRKEYYDPQEMGYFPESVKFLSGDDLKLHGWWFAAEGDAVGTVVHCHGNAGNVTGHFAHTAWLSREGFNVLSFDYRGYGHSQGSPSREGTIADAQAAIEYVKSRKNVDARSIVLFGQSLGGSVAIVAAAQRHDLVGVAVDGPFSHYQQEAEWVLRQSWLTRGVARLIPRWFISNGFDAIDYVDQVAPAPLYIFHGKEDRIVPWEMSQDLYDRAREPKALWLVDGLDHDEALHELAEVARPKLVQFYEACIEASRFKNPDPPSFDAQTAGGE